jgi:hypothetical protein
MSVISQYFKSDPIAAGVHLITKSFLNGKNTFLFNKRVSRRSKDLNIICNNVCTLSEFKELQDNVKGDEAVRKILICDGPVAEMVVMNLQVPFQQRIS